MSPIADNVAVTAGSGTTLAADDISSVKYQRVKVTVGKDGVNTGDLAGYTVDTDQVGVLTRDRPDYREFTPTVTVNTAAYVAGDCIGGLFTLTSAVAVAGNWLRLQRIAAATLVNTGGLTLWLFDDNPSATTFTDHSAFPSINSADVAKVRSVTAITASSVGGFYLHQSNALIADLPTFPLVGTSLYAALSVTATPDFVASGDFKLLSIVAERL